MSEPFIGEIRMFAGNFAPLGWAFCDGQLLAISEYDALFSLLGTTYGGDGQTTFGLPDLRGRIPIHAGTGPGLSARQVGQAGGSESVTLTINQIPAHSHPLLASGELAGRATPENNFLARITNNDLYSGDPPDTPLSSQAVGAAGGSQSHTNLMPYLCINFVIALFGIYPPMN